MSKIAARSGKVAVEPPKPVTVRLDFGGGDVETVVIDRGSLSYAESHKADVVIAKLTVRDDDGRVILEPDINKRVLVYAWVVLVRRRAIAWDDLFSGLSTGSGAEIVPDEVDNSPEV